MGWFGTRKAPLEVTDGNEKEGVFARFGMTSTAEAGQQEVDDTHGWSWALKEDGSLGLLPNNAATEAERVERDARNAAELAEMHDEAEARYKAERWLPAESEAAEREIESEVERP